MIALITGSAGLVGGETVRFLTSKGFTCVGIDNDMRSSFFGAEASTAWNRQRLQDELGERYLHRNLDIRDLSALEKVFLDFAGQISLIVHTAAQPSHDWAARDPLTDFSVNATGTLHMLEMTRRHAPEATFIFTSTNKVYGDRPNELPLIELDSRWELDPSHPFAEHGIDESMSIDASLHSVFGASKVAADVMVQEYGRYFGLKTGVFRGGCLTGPTHSGAELHGFLAYLMRCAVEGREYTVFGYKGKQVRDNIHSRDLANAFWHFHQSPRPGRVYNIGGARHSNCSMAEAIAACEVRTGKKMKLNFSDQARSGDHIWYVSDVRRFKQDFPSWKHEISLDSIFDEICQATLERSRA